MSETKFTVRRSRLGRFNFAFETDYGRGEGSVTIQSGSDRSRQEIEDAAYAQIRVLVDMFVQAAEGSRACRSIE